MPDPVIVRDILLKGNPQSVSFSISSGVSAVVVTSGQEANDQFVRLLLGLEYPAVGEVTLFGQSLTHTTERELRLLRERVGTVHTDGGLISNLRVWENLVLPLAYRRVLSSDEISARGRDVLQQLGYDGDLQAASGTLSLYQKRLLGLGRAMLTDPDLLLVSGILGGLSEPERQNLATNMSRFHHEKPGRITMYITANLKLINEFDADRVIRLRGE